MEAINNPKTSIILPVYNGELTIEKTIKSILNQSYNNFELIISLDGCTDQSEKIIRNFSDKRLKIFNYYNRVGLGRNMNRLIYLCSNDTEYIAIAEQDDFYLPERIKLQIEYLQKHKNIGMVSGIAEFLSNNNKSSFFPGLLIAGNSYPLGEKMFLLNYLEQSKIVNSCIMFRKEVHINNGLYFTTHLPNVSIDWEYFLRFSLIADIGGINKVLVKINRNIDRNSITKNRYNVNRANRELIKNFKFEYPRLILSKHYKYALNTQRLMEIGHLDGFLFLIYNIFYILINQFEKRFYKYLLKRVKRFLDL